MATKQVLFFATKNDLIQVIEKIEAETSVKYHRGGLLNKEELKEYSSLMQEGIGVSKYGDNNLCTSYLVINDNLEFEIRNLPQRNGEVKYALDQKLNRASIFFRPCGIYKKEQAIIEGKLATISEEKLSIQLFNIFFKELKSKFTKVKGYLVGKEAFEYYNSGWRLTQNAHTPKEYDLKLIKCK